MYVVTVVLPRVQEEFGVGRSDASLPYTLTMIGFGLGGVLMGRRSDRYGGMVPVIIGALGLSAGFIAAGTSGSGFLQVVDNLAIQFIDAGLAVALREILRPLLADGYFFGPLAAVRDHAGIEYGLSATFFGELGGGQVAQFIDQVLHAD